MTVKSCDEMLVSMEINVMLKPTIINPSTLEKQTNYGVSGGAKRH